MLIEEIFDHITRLYHEQFGTTVLVIEHNACQGLELAHRGRVLERGRIALTRSADALREVPHVKEFHLELGEQGQGKSYRDDKHYKRQRAWL